MRSNRNHDRKRLEQELGGETYTSLLRQLHEAHAFLRRFGDWTDFIAFMREGTSDDPPKEEALLAILKTHAADRDPRWRAVLLAVFWPGLDSIFNRKKHWDTDADERWQNVQWAFLQTVCRLNVRRRTDSLVQRLVSGTIHRLHDEYRRVWRLGERETATDPEQLEELLEGGEELDFDAMDLRSKQDAEIKRLREHADAGRISEADFLLLVGTRVYGKSAAQYARETGMSCDLARKRRLRAEAAIRRAEEGR
jgi:hypothetical protein